MDARYLLTSVSPCCRRRLVRCSPHCHLIALDQPAPLQQEHGVARGSVRRAMELLRKEGWVVTIQGRGTFVALKENWPNEG
ncbi:regulatory GntR family protein [Nonomuraea polychroma]|uniref:Regulatory GntR family protein n=1 Tax=Nonomuraea polychroma TaxID=46176 RepID=A0A438MH67_9ACTN|nr:GntR family transcriptional regulator [Nonomuraea polychroma]RVX45192.1 regulatory GntR family protein [Nonomuraea polychroma]